MKIEDVLKLPFGKLLDEFKSCTGISANKLGTIVGVSGSQLSQIRNGTYKDVDGTEDKVRTYIVDELKKQDLKVFTPKKLNFTYIRAARNRIAQNITKNKIILVRGDSGTGKTTLLREFKKKHSNSFMIQAYKGMKKSELIKLICKGAGFSVKSTSLSDIVPRIQGKILILDEANKLSGGSLEWLRSLHDRSGISMLWGGTYEDITEVLSRQPELNRRCKKVHMENLTEAQLLELVKSYELKNSELYKNILWKHFGGLMGMSVEVLNDMKGYVLNGDMKDNETTFINMIEMME